MVKVLYRGLMASRVREHCLGEREREGRGRGYFNMGLYGARRLRRNFQTSFLHFAYSKALLLEEPRHVESSFD